MLTVHERTPHAAGAICVLGLEGAEALAAAGALAQRAGLKVGEVFVAKLVFEGEELDEALVVVRAKGSVELHLHGSPPLVGQLIEILCDNFDAVVFEPATSLEARAEERIALAPCEEGARILLDQASGALRSSLLEICGLDTERGAEALRVLLQRGVHARFALRPAVLVLAGPVNAGKSTLFNLMVGEDRALTSDLEGTTRDLVRARGLLGPWPVEWIDTAGERALVGTTREEEVELEGQRLSAAVRAECDLCFWLAPAGAADPKLPAGLELCRLETFGDQAGSGSGAISALADPAGAARAVQSEFERALGLSRPLWTPGLAVPFDEAQLALLRGWIELEAPARVLEIEAWLADS